MIDPLTELKPLSVYYRTYLSTAVILSDARILAVVLESSLERSDSSRFWPTVYLYIAADIMVELFISLRSAILF